MKRIISILVLLVFFTNINAQTEHAKFMDIPINGTINQFHQKLQTKGIQFDQIGSRELLDGQLLYRGSFYGDKAEFYVGYTSISKTVVYVGVFIECYNTESLNNKYNRYRKFLAENYHYRGIDENGRQIYLITSSSGDVIGDIQFYYKNEYDLYTLRLIYRDYKNMKLKE